MVETRSQAQGKPLKKPGAYNTDLYYQEKDEGFGDVGVDQEPDAGTMDEPSDPNFNPTAQEMKSADETAVQEDRTMPVDETNVREEEADLKQSGDSGQQQLDERGEPVPMVETTAEEEEEANAAGYTVTE